MQKIKEKMKNMEKIKRIISIIVIFIAANTFCFAEENEQNEMIENMETIVYIHPISGIFISSISAFQGEGVYLYLTIENALSLSNSLIIKPSAWINVSEFTIFGKAPKLYRFGSDIGIRHYPNKKGKGFYMQGQIGVFHVSRMKEGYYFYDYGCQCSLYTNETYVSYDFAADVMGYVGYSWKFSKWSMFLDFGFGFGDNLHLSGDAIPDINFGVGLKF